MSEPTDNDLTVPEAPKRRGRPPRAQGAPAQAPRAHPRGAVSYTSDGRAIVTTATGERLTRKRPDNVDPFIIPDSMIPQGMEYQWNRVSLSGQPDMDDQVMMRENGWRPVPAGRHQGQFMPPDYPAGGEILRGGLRLEERPKVLSDEARAEAMDRARKQVMDQNAHLRLVEKIPQGFTRDNPRLRAMERRGTSQTYAPAADIRRPALQIED